MGKRVAGLAGVLLLTGSPASADCIDRNTASPAELRIAEEGDLCKPAEIKPNGPRRPLTKVEQTAIANAVRERLKDPESARFKWPPMRGQGGAFCGLVNAKNSYGGYVGFVPFLAFIAGKNPARPAVVVIDMADADPTSTRSVVVAQMCADAGY